MASPVETSALPAIRMAPLQGSPASRPDVGQPTVHVDQTRVCFAQCQASEPAAAIIADRELIMRQEAPRSWAVKQHGRVDAPPDASAGTGFSQPRRIESPWAFSLDLLAGGSVACVAHTVVAPIERIKLVLQTQDTNVAMLSGQHRHYQGFFDALRTMIKEEGFWSLWRGNFTSVVRYIPSMSLNFAFKDYYRVLFAPSYVDGTPSALRLAGGNLAAGAAAGATSLFFTYPLDIAHTRLATDIGTRKQFSGLLHFLRTAYLKEGIVGLYRGFPASVHGIIVHRSIYFGGFDSAKQLLFTNQDASDGAHALHSRSHKGSFWARWLLAQAATTSASLVSYPFDTVRHRMMMQTGAEKPEYVGTWDCWRKILRKEGIRGFYKGLLSNILRGTGAAFVLVMYDEVQGHIHRALHVQ